jgi:multiple sugar transport system permease protein
MALELSVARRHRWRAGADRAGIYLLLGVACILFVVPILWILSTSFKTPGEIFVTPTTLLPQQPTAQNYGAVVEGEFGRYLVNSLIAAGGATGLGLLLALPAAFGFAKFRYRSSSALLSFIVLTRVFPPIALTLPFFLQFRALGLIDTPLGLVVAYVPIVLPLMIWILEGFLRDFPDELLDAARIDGGGALRMLVHIIVPTSWPAIGVATLFGFLVAWNEFVIALTITRTPAAQTMPVGISTLITQFQTFWGEMMAVAAIYLVPVLAVTVVAQRGLVRGLMTGATKG